MTQNQAKRNTFKVISAHFDSYKALYGIFLTLGISAWGATVAVGQNWLASEIDHRIDLKLESVRAEISEIRLEVRCEAIDNRISALRTELRNVETDLFQAEQQSNMALVIQLRERQSMIRDEIKDETDRRQHLRCITLPR